MSSQFIGVWVFLIFAGLYIYVYFVHFDRRTKIQPWTENDFAILVYKTKSTLNSEVVLNLLILPRMIDLLLNGLVVSV